MVQEFRLENMTLKVCFTRSEKQNRKHIGSSSSIKSSIYIFSQAWAPQIQLALSLPLAGQSHSLPPPLFSQAHCVGAKGPELTNEPNCPLSQQPTGSGTKGSHRTAIVSTVSARRSRKLTLSTNQSQMWIGSKGSRPRENDLFLLLQVFKPLYWAPVGSEAHGI